MIKKLTKLVRMTIKMVTKLYLTNLRVTLRKVTITLSPFGSILGVSSLRSEAEDLI